MALTVYAVHNGASQEIVLQENDTLEIAAQLEINNKVLPLATARRVTELVGTEALPSHHVVLSFLLPVGHQVALLYGEEQPVDITTEKLRELVRRAYDVLNELWEREPLHDWRVAEKVYELRRELDNYVDPQEA